MRLYLSARRASVLGLCAGLCLLLASCQPAAGPAGGAAAGPAKYAAALAMVRPDHYALVKIDMAAVLDSKLVKSFPVPPEEMANTMAAGDPDKKDMARALLDVESFCVSVGPPPAKPEPGAPPLSLGVYARFKNPEGLKKFVETFNKRTVAATHNGQEYFKPKPQSDGPFYKVSGNELYFSTDEATILQVIDGKGALPDVPLVKKLSGVNLSPPILIAGSLGPMKEMAAMAAQGAAKQSPFEKAGELPAQFEWGVVAVDLDGAKVIDIDADMQSDKGAEQLKASLDEALGMAKKQMADMPPPPKESGMEPAVSLAKGLLAEITVERNGKHVDLTLGRSKEFDQIPQMVGKAIQQARNAARQAMVMNNGKMLILALMNAEQATRKFPKNVTGDDGKPLLSWRVAILPYIEEGTAFEKLRKNEPWDSENNRKLHSAMPTLLKSEAAPEPHQTAWRMLPANPLQIVLIEVGQGAAVPWMQPDELKLDLANLKASLGEPSADGYVVVFKDGRVARMGAKDLATALQVSP